MSDSKTSQQIQISAGLATTMNHSTTMAELMKTDPTTIDPDTLNAHLPKGIWWDAEKSKFRVRLYRNRRPLQGGYHDTLEEALGAFEELKKFREQIPGDRVTRKAPQSLAFADTCKALLNSHKTRKIILRIAEQ